MLCTLLRPTSGSALVNGYDVGKQQVQVRQSIGIIFQDASLDDKLTGRENLFFQGPFSCYVVSLFGSNCFQS